MLSTKIINVSDVVTLKDTIIHIFQLRKYLVVVPAQRYAEMGWILELTNVTTEITGMEMAAHQDAKLRKTMVAAGERP
jgi:hypothetical protein